MVIAEYLVGVRLTTDAARAERQRTFLDEVLQVTPVQDYTCPVAEHHADLLAHVRRTGAPRGAHDLIIAATARAAARTVLTTDRQARFADLPGVRVQFVERS